jgi:hypothetical protein
VEVKSCVFWASSWHNNIDDHDSCQGDTANILARKWHPAMLFLLSSSINNSHCPSIIVKVHHSLLMFALPLLEQLPADHMGSTAMDE